LVTVVQRAGSGLKINLHFHTLALDGVFSAGESADGLAFHPAPAPTDAEVAETLGTIRHRVRRLLMRRGLETSETSSGPADPLAEESPVLAGIVSASVQGRIALGARSGARVRRLGEGPDAAAMSSHGPRHAHLDGFDLHADVWVAARDRAGLERLCRYVLRPPLAQERLRVRDDGRVQLDLKTPWHDGTRHLVFEPVEFLERLAALIPRPEVNLIICHGVLAPHARWRASVVAYGRPASEAVDALGAGDSLSAPRASPEDGRGKPSPRSWSWAALMQRAFAIDVLACPSCGGRMRLIATIHDPAVIRRILDHLRPCSSGASSGPGPPPSTLLTR
jgi:hypothetical protein